MVKRLNKTKQGETSEAESNLKKEQLTAYIIHNLCPLRGFAAEMMLDDAGFCSYLN